MSTNVFLPTYILKPLAVLAAAGITSIAVLSFKAGAAVGRKHPNTPQDVPSLLAAAATDKITEHAVKVVKKGSVKVNKHVASFAASILAKRTGLPKEVIAKIPSLVDEITRRFAQKKAETINEETDSLHMQDLAHTSVADLQNKETPTVVDADLLARETSDYISDIIEEAAEVANGNHTETKEETLKKILLPEPENLETEITEEEKDLIEEIIEEVVEQETEAAEHAPEQKTEDKKASSSTDKEDKNSNVAEDTFTILKDKVSGVVSKENIGTVVNFVNKNEEALTKFFKNINTKNTDK